MIILPILSTSLIRFSLKGWENVVFEVRSERVGTSPSSVCCRGWSGDIPPPYRQVPPKHRNCANSEPVTGICSDNSRINPGFWTYPHPWRKGRQMSRNNDWPDFSIHQPDCCRFRNTTSVRNDVISTGSFPSLDFSMMSDRTQPMASMQHSWIFHLWREHLPWVWVQYNRVQSTCTPAKKPGESSEPSCQCSLLCLMTVSSILCFGRLMIDLGFHVQTHAIRHSISRVALTQISAYTTHKNLALRKIMEAMRTAYAEKWVSLL